MPVSNPKKRLGAGRLSCDGETTLMLGFTASPELLEAPADLVLVLDRSCSMDRERMQALRQGAWKLVEDVSSASGGIRGATFGGGTRVGLVSYASEARTEVPPGTDAAPVRRALEELRPGGATDHARALLKAQTLFDPRSRNRRILVLFTDGRTNAGDDPAAVAECLKAAGTELFCVGLGKTLPPLCQCASEPTTAHLAETAEVSGLGAAFDRLCPGIVRSGALRAVVREELEPDFELVRVEEPRLGTVHVMTPRSLKWSIPAAGVTGTEEAALTLRIRHVGRQGGIKAVNRAVSYEDARGGTLTFPSPTVQVDCGGGGGVCPEPCPDPTTITLDACSHWAEAELPDVALEGGGSIVSLRAVIRNVCPGKRVAAAVVLTELDPCGREHPRGMKTFTLPAREGPGCGDLELRCVRFVVPGDLNVSSGPCGRRIFRARVLANYVDTDLICCDEAAAVL